MASFWRWCSHDEKHGPDAMSCIAVKRLMTEVLDAQFPPWVVLHVPHDSTFIPPEVRDQFVLEDQQLEREVRVMTDLFTLRLFAHGLTDSQIVKSPVSRLVVDVERFDIDEQEPMAKQGMGVIYERTHKGCQLRRPLTNGEREQLLLRWYRPHHQALSAAVDRALDKYGRALVLDAHSFPSRALPYETNESAFRPEICIGTDQFHTSPGLVDSLSQALNDLGFETALNTPFSGALVPAKHFRQDSRVEAVMIEVRRDLYLDESSGQLSKSLELTAKKLQAALLAGLSVSPGFTVVGAGN